MLDFNNLTVSRMTMHTINPKLEHQDHASTEYGESLLQLDDNVLEIIKTRLIDAAGKHSKAFELEIENINDGSVYSLCNDLKSSNDEEFIQVTKELVDLLAETQTKVNIPGGYLIVLDCLDEFSHTAAYIFIKAEPHEALQTAEGLSQISLLRKVFLSPSQKLYKIGAIYERENPVSDSPNDLFGCFLFDDQFRIITHPAEYFYKDFLGFSIGNNSKIQSQRFYDKTEKFIKSNVDDLDVKTELLRALRVEFTASQASTINPHNFAQTYLPANILRDKYITEVVHELPPSIVKDHTLIKNRLNNRKVEFPNKINITGPDEGFEDRVQFLNDDDLGTLDLSEDGYTLVRIWGKPFSND